MADIDDTWHRIDRVTGKKVRTARYGKGLRWVARYRESGRQRKKAFAKQYDAERWLSKTLADLAAGTWVDPQAGRVTVSDYGPKHRGEQLHRDSTADYAERAFRLHVDPVLGHLQLGQVRPSHIRAWVKDRSRVLAPSTLRVVYAYLAGMFAHAAADRLIGTTPCVNIRLPELDGARVIPTPVQVHALADALPARYQGIPLLAAACGLRVGEILGLELDSVDFLRHQVHVRQQLKVLPGRVPYLGEVKTKTSRRTVELPDAGGMPLAQHLEAFPPGPVEIEDETDPRKPIRRSAVLIFTNHRGAPIHRSGWSQVWARAAKKVGLPPGTGLHACRHLYATALIHSGASVKTVQLALGHATPMTTLNTYVGEWPDALDRTRAIIDRALDVTQMCPEREASW
jgi:integrase